jgi:hypothetical protein
MYILIIMKEYTFKLYDNFLPNPSVIKPLHMIVNFKYCNLSELSWIDEDFNTNIFNLPNTINYFDVSYNSIYAFYKGSSHNYILPENLKVLNVSFNKLDFISDNVPKQLIALNISNNTIKYIPKLPETIKILNGSNNTIKWFDQELPNLEKLNLSYNHIYYFRFDRLKDNLRFLDLSGNQLKEITGDIFPPNIEIIRLIDNRLEKVPELPAKLKEFDISYNKIKSISNYPVSLVELDVSHNLLEVLCNSIMGCNDMKKLNYEANDTIEISFDSLRWIDKQFHKTHIEKEINLKEIYLQTSDEMKSVYDDAQNAHDIKIRSDILKCIELIIETDEVPVISFDECSNFLKDKFKIEDTINILYEFIDEQVKIKEKSYSFKELFPYIYNRVIQYGDDLIFVLEDEIQKSKKVCFTGRIEAYISSLAGFYKDIIYSPSLNDTILAKIKQIKNKLHKERIPSDSLNYQVELKFYMEEYMRESNFAEDIIKIWLSPIVEMIDDIIKQLEDHYKKPILEIIDIIKMRKVIKQYFIQSI